MSSLAAVGLRLAIGVWIGAAGLVMFLPFVFGVTYLTGRVWGYAALAVNTLLIWFVVLRPALSFSLPPLGQVTDISLMLLTGVGTIEFVRLLDQALHGLALERDQSRLLLRELHHRTGNNFQIVSSMLSLVRRAVDDPAAKKALLAADERVAALGIVHRQLVSSAEGSVDIDQLFPALCSDFERQLGAPITYFPGNLGLVGSRVASSLALVAYELIASAVGRAGKDSSNPISVRLERAGQGMASLYVEDLGPGIAVVDSLPQKESVSSTVLQTFVGSIGGTVDVQSKLGGKGVTAVARFSLS